MLKTEKDDEDKLTRRIDGSGQGRDMTLINESGVYSLIFYDGIRGNHNIIIVNKAGEGDDLSNGRTGFH